MNGIVQHHTTGITTNISIYFGCRKFVIQNGSIKWDTTASAIVTVKKEKNE